MDEFAIKKRVQEEGEITWEIVFGLLNKVDDTIVHVLKMIKDIPMYKRDNYAVRCFGMAIRITRTLSDIPYEIARPDMIHGDRERERNKELLKTIQDLVSEQPQKSKSTPKIKKVHS